MYHATTLNFVALTLLHLIEPVASAHPRATTLNGTFEGLYLPGWNQDAFLGIPFAQPPVGPLRYAWPQTLNDSFSSIRSATQYGYSCYQYNSNFNLSEDCLTLNVIRPSTSSGNGSIYASNNESLPVLVWIYGGGLYAGSTADPQYNLSGIVEISQSINEPTIAVSMNYRLGQWGFLQTPQLLQEGNANAGLMDQRMALRWIQENIAAFGGDPNRVTVWGESAGAQSIGLHLHSYDGRDDGLFQAAIMESGGPVGAQIQDLPYYASPVENLTRTVGCFGVEDQLACLRNVSSEDLFSAHPSQVWNPMIDGNVLTDYPSSLTPEEKFVKIPIITGANTDEGSSFSVHGLETTEDVYYSLFSWRSYELSPPSIKRLLELYPNDPANEPPYHIHENITYEPYGQQWRRSAAIGGDMVIISQRRKMAGAYTNAGEAVYSYRFDTPAWNASQWTAVQHFVNVQFSFQNISGSLGPLPQYESYRELSRQIGEAYVHFVNRHDPNPVVNSTLGFPKWPRYSIKEPKNLVMNSNGSFVEVDTWRKEGIDFINSIDRELCA